MMHIYILTETYPSEERKYQMAFIHPRVKGYIDAGYDVRVISLGTSVPYEYDGVKVYDLKNAEKLLHKEYAIILLSHSPNLRHHLPFIEKWDKKISSLVLFFHGHESLTLRKYYPKPYSFDKRGRLIYLFHRFYDPIKTLGLHIFIKRRLKKQNTHLIFVSEWFLNQASKCMRLNLHEGDFVHVINNGLNPYIQEASYCPHHLKADFIAIRPIDKSKYSVDLVVNFAEKHPELTFHVYGKGVYFNYNKKPANLEVFNTFFLPKDIPGILNNYRYAICPTKQDTQGVMMCEMASHGIPTIVSDMDVCHEMLDEYSNVLFLPNEDFDCKESEISQPLKAPVNRFSFDKTIGKEIELLNALSK